MESEQTVKALKALQTPQLLLFLLGANHRSAPVELREQLYISPEELKALLPKIKEQYKLRELVALSTCNRFELIGVATHDQASSLLHASLYEAYLELHRGSSNHKHLDDDLVRQSTYLHLNDQAVNHIYRVAASLDSLVLGETQITGQFKDAFILAQEIRTLGPTLSRLSQEALATAKKVRTQTDIGKKHVSISHAAIELAKKVFGDLSEHRFLIVGAGEMSQVAIKYIMSYQPRAIYVANRTVERARDLVHQLGAGEAFGLEELPNLLVSADIVLSSTAAPGLVIDAAMVKRAQAARRGRPIFLLDIAMPRDIDTACSQLDDVYLFDLDDLQQVVGANYEERRVAAEEAQILIDKGVDNFAAWLKTLAVKPTLASFRAWLEELIQREAGKTLSKDQFKDLNPKQLESLTSMFEAIINKIANEASRQVTNPPAGYYQEQLADALQTLFPYISENQRG